MPATCKAELRAVADKEFTKLQKLLDQIPDDLALAPDSDGITPKDIIAHRAHWIALFLGWYHAGQAGLAVEIPAPGYKWNELKRYNADLRAAQQDISWTEACAMLWAWHLCWLGLIDDLDDSALFGGPMKGGNNKWTTGRWAEAAAPSHYRSAAKYLKQRLKTYQSTG